jgi:SAM-dependent methyltransferase
VDVKQQMDRIYGGLAPEAIPWNLEHPPRQLVELVDSGWVMPGDAVDLGCGAGHYAVWLASRGFRVTGVDISPTALALAARLAAEKGVACRFLALDLTAEAAGLDAAFDFAYDWEVLHHVFPEERAQYISNVHRMLRPHGRYLSVCFSEEDAGGFPGDGKRRMTRLGTMLYFSSEAELRQLFDPWFEVEALGQVEIAGKFGPHRPFRALLIRRG